MARNQRFSCSYGRSCVSAYGFRISLLLMLEELGTCSEIGEAYFTISDLICRGEINQMASGRNCKFWSLLNMPLMIKSFCSFHILNIMRIFYFSIFKKYIVSTLTWTKHIVGQKSVENSFIKWLVLFSWNCWWYITVLLTKSNNFRQLTSRLRLYIYIRFYCVQISLQMILHLCTGLIIIVIYMFKMHRMLIMQLQTNKIIFNLTNNIYFWDGYNSIFYLQQKCYASAILHECC